MKEEGVGLLRMSLVVGALCAAHVSLAGGLDCVDPLIGTEGSGSEYGGMQPYTCVPFGSFHAVPMTRTNRIGRQPGPSAGVK